MRRIVRKLFLSTAATLVAATILVVTLPITGLAVTCWTTCPNGDEIQCTGVSCTYVAGQSVTCYDADGNASGVRCDPVADDEEPILDGISGGDSN